jgi:hypothetical protein
VLEFNDDITVSATGFAGKDTMCINDLSIANVAYAYDTPQGDTLIFVVNNAIYLGDLMDGSLLNPVQRMEHGIKIDIRPRLFYPDTPTAQTFEIPSLQRLFPIQYEGSVPFLHVRKPTQEEIQTCTHVEITSRSSWDPHCINGINSCTIDDMVMPHLEDDDLSNNIMQFHIAELISEKQSLYPYLGFATANVASLSSRKQFRITPEQLNKLWGVGVKTCERTLKATTHTVVRTTGALTRRFRTDRAQMRYKQLGTHFGKFSVDTVKAKVKSIRGYTCGNVYINRCGYKKFYGMHDFASLSSRDTLVNFIQHVGIPAALHSDNHGNFKEGAFRKETMKYGIPQTFTEPHSPWQNPAEGGIREVKKLSKKWMTNKESPVRLWCFCFELAADILSLCATMHYSLQGRTPYEITCNYTPDISEYVTFLWYDWVYYWDEHSKDKRIGRWLGPAHRVGQSLCYYILLNEDANYLARSSVVPIPAEDMNSAVIKNKLSDFNQLIEAKIGNSKTAIYDPENPLAIYHENYDDPLNDDDVTHPFESEIQDYQVQDAEAQLEELDKYIGAQVLVPDAHGEHMVLAKIVDKKRDSQGNVIGAYNPNPLLDTHIYKLQYPNGHIEEFATNQIAENLYAQMDEFGYNEGILDEIIDVRKNADAIPASEGFVESIHGIRKPVITTKGWDVQVRWRDGSFDWLPLSDIKESNPVQCAEYAILHGMDKEPAFNWWVRSVL